MLSLTDSFFIFFVLMAHAFSFQGIHGYLWSRVCLHVYFLYVCLPSQMVTSFRAGAVFCSLL